MLHQQTLIGKLDVTLFSWTHPVLYLRSFHTQPCFLVFIFQEIKNFTMRRSHVYQKAIEILHDFSTNGANTIVGHVLKTKEIFKLLPVVGYGVVL